MLTANSFIDVHINSTAGKTGFNIGIGYSKAS